MLSRFFVCVFVVNCFSTSIAYSTVYKELPLFETEALPVLKQFCFECHSGEDAEADIDLRVGPSGIP